MQLTAQIISIAAAALNIFSYQMKENRRMFLMKGLSGALFALTYFLLGNLTSASLNLLNLVRGAMLADGDRWQERRWMILNQALYLAAGILTFGRSTVLFGGATLAMVLSVLVTAVQLAETWVLWGGNGRHIRLAQLSFVSPCWLFSNIAVGSIGGIITEVFAMASVIVSLLRYGLRGFDDPQQR